ncbi:MAG: DNA recombination protein RmuC [Lachnospiraceae bacterium]|nr:DNA recombination protein RmuC [Lachnospiraceae bacterium]
MGLSDIILILIGIINIVLVLILIVTRNTDKHYTSSINDQINKITSIYSSINNSLTEIKYSQQSIKDMIKDTDESVDDLNSYLQKDSYETKNAMLNELHNTIDSKIDQLSRTLTTSISSLGTSISTGQSKQSSSYSIVLDRIKTEITEIKDDISKELIAIRNENKSSIDKTHNISQNTIDRISKELDTIRDTNERSLSMMQGENKSNTDKVVETLNKIRDDNRKELDNIRSENQKSLDKINDTVNEKLQKSLNDRISQSFETVTKQLAEVYTGIGEMKSIASGVSDLKNVLSNVKNRGILGEVQLSVILSDILTQDQFNEQCSIDPNSNERVDFAIKLPGTDDEHPVYLPIDSKFPGDRYASLVEAYNNGDIEDIKSKKSLLAQELKRSAKDIQSKYIVPPYSTDFAIMFLPFEGLYAEAINLGLVEVLQREYRVNIAGPSTMAAMLNSLQMGFRTLAIQRKSSEVWKILGATKKEFEKFEGVLESTRKKLQQADDELEKLVGTRTRAITKSLRNVSSIDESDSSSVLLDLDDD